MAQIAPAGHGTGGTAPATPRAGTEPGPVDEAEAEAAERARADRRRRALRATWGDMVRSLIVIVAVVAGLILLVPRPDRVRQAPVDLGSAAAAATRALGYDVSVPEGLPETWIPVDATVSTGSDGTRMWAVSYETPTGYAGLRESAEPTEAWESVQVLDGDEGARQTIGGVTWTHRDRPDRGTTGLVRREGGITTIVLGLGSAEAALTLAAATPMP